MSVSMNNKWNVLNHYCNNGTNVVVQWISGISHSISGELKWINDDFVCLELTKQTNFDYFVNGVLYIDIHSITAINVCR
jgi:hypothetical protein